VAQSKYEIDMSTGSLPKLIIRFVIPQMLSGILQLLYNAADTIVVGRYVGSTALAAVGSTGSLTNLIINLFIGLSVGASVAVAQYYGAKDYKNVSQTVHTAMGISVIFGFVSSAVGIALAKVFLQAMGTPAEVLPHSVVYMRIYFAGMPASMVFNFGSSILRAVGDTKRPFIFLSISGTVNVILNMVFVIVFRMGVAGVALSTIISQLLKIAFGVWDHIKNRGDHGADCWELEWVGFLPGKRESRRYVGDYIMTQNDVRSEGKFEDMVAYGGWPMDDHNPDGFLHKGEPTIFHPAPAPFGIPYRCLYSKNIENLFFAGRNISVTHAALSSTRVMGTCSLLGQAVGTAAAMAKKYDCTPRDIYRYHIKELQQTLMDDDCYLPWHKRDVGELTQKAILTASEGDPEVLRNGIDRPVKEEDNGWYGKIGSFVEYRFEKPVLITRCRLVFDSDLERESCSGHLLYRTLPMLCNRFYNMEPFGFPKTMVKDFDLEYLDEEGAWRTLKKVRNNYQRLYKIDVHVVTRAVRFIPRETYGDSRVHVFAFDVR
jgi:hypothetical protein